MNLLGIDFGEARIGLAVAEAGFAVPLKALERSTDRIAVAEIATLVREREIDVLIMGLPMGLDGNENSACERVRRFGDKLTARSRRPVHYVNESLTSYEAQERLEQAGVRLSARAGAIDAMSATLLLQEWIDSSADQSAEDPTGESL